MLYLLLKNNANSLNQEVFKVYFYLIHRSIVMGYQSIRCGDASVVVAGGQESMSQSVHACHMRTGIKFGNAELKDTMITDGLTDAFNNIHMGITGENLEGDYL